MSKKRLRENDMAALDAAIADNMQPRAPKAARGLILSIPGGRARKLVDVSGAKTAAGEYYEDRTGKGLSDRGFDYAQEPTRQGSRLQIALLDGQKATVRTWDGVKRQWRFTKTGEEFYKDSKDHFVVTIPIIQVLVRKNKTTWEDASVMKSTAIAELGEIALPTLMPDAEQLAEVKRRADAYLASLPEVDGRKVILEGGGSQATVTLDTSRSLEYNKESINVRPDGSLNVSAVLHRPLRNAKPWAFGFRGVCPEAFDETENRCVPHQLEAVLRKTLGFTEADLDRELDKVYEQLYPANSEDNPYELEAEDGSLERRNWREAGVTCAMIQAFAKLHGLAAHILWGDTKIASYTPAEAVTSLCLYVYGDHAFFVDDPHTKSVIAKMQATKPRMRSDVVLAVRVKSDAPPAKDWREYLHGSPPGHYYADDLAQVRLELHSKGVCPKLQLSGVGTAKALRIREKAGDVVIHRRRPEACVCELFAELFEKRLKRPLVYHGESLASFANRAFVELLRPPPVRKQLTENQYQIIWEKQSSACNLCGCAGNGKMNVDHIAPRCVGGEDGFDNLQIICSNCHASKTCIEMLSFVEDEHPLLSRFSLETHKAFVEAKKPPQLVANLHEREDDALSVDIIRCRYNAFVHQDAWDLPVFAPTDEMVPATPGRLGDFQWIDIGPLGSNRSARSVLPYFGPGWYGAATAAFLLDAGIAKWPDVHLTFNAAAHRPAKYVGERLEKLEELWQEIGATFVGHAFLEQRGAAAEPRLLAKYASVALLGVWGAREHHRYRHETTSCEQDSMFAGTISVSNTPGSPEEDGVCVFKDIVSKQRVLELTSMRPIHQKCLEEERLQVARALIKIRQWCAPQYHLSLRVDEVFAHVAKRDVPKFKQQLGSITYAELHTILPPGRRPLHQRASTSTAPVYRVKSMEPQLPGGTLTLPDATPAPEIPELTWNTIDEPLEGPDNFAEQIVEHAVSGGALTVLGAAGTGKTVVMRATLAALRQQGLGCAAICLTHTGARNIGPEAVTAHSFVMKHVLHGTFAGDVVLIDEISFVSLDLLAALEHLRLKGVRLICFGDFGQLPPVCNRWRGQKVDANVFEHSRLFKVWSGGNRFVLRRCRRSDQAHFDFYTSLRAAPLYESLEAARERYPPRASCDWNIAMSHFRRKAINGRMQRAAAAAHRGPKIWIEAETPFHCFEGTRLIGCNNTSKSIVNGAFLLVTALERKTIWLRDEDSGEEFETSAAQVAKYTRLRWALTLFSVQGRSLVGTIAVHDTGSQHFSTTHLYVALSRATDGANVAIVS